MDLSTIIEADTSGISKHLPSVSNSASSSPSSSRLPSQSPSPLPFSPPSIDRDTDMNDSSHLELELSTSQITSQVANDWLKDANARVVDVDADESLIIDDEFDLPTRRTLVVNMDTVDPALAALLSPHKIPPGPGQDDNENETIVIPKPVRPPSSPLSSSQFNSTIVDDHLPHRPQQQSSLPRPRSHKPSSSAVAADTFDPPFFDNGVKDDQSKNMVRHHNQRQEHKAKGTPIASEFEALSPPSSASSSGGNQNSPSSPSPSSPAPSSTIMPPSAKPSYPPSMSTTSLSSSISRRRGNTTTSHTTPLASTASLGLDPGSESGSISPVRRYQRRNLGIGLPSSSSPLPPRAREEVPGRRSLDSPTTSPSPRRNQTQARHGTEYARPSVSEYGEILGRGSLDLEPSPRIVSSGTRPSVFEMRRQRKRSMSMEDHNLSLSVGRYARSRGTATPSISRASDARPGSSLSARYPEESGNKARPPVMEWLGPRTAKAFRAAGLMDSDRDRDRDKDRDDSPGYSSPGVEQIRRFGSVRSTTTRTHSRAEAGYGQRRGSGSYFSGASVGMESPTYTISSSRGGEREWPPRSASTAPTSVSGISSGREEIAALKEKHAVETEALLSALADSQRTTRVLREENTELRERLQEAERVEDLCEELRSKLRRVEEENEKLRRFIADLVVDSASDARSNEKELETQPQRRTRAFLATANKGSLGRHNGAIIASPLRHTTPPSPSPPPTATKDSFGPEDTDVFLDDEVDRRFNVASTSTPAGHRRRFSTASSSIFPAPPANMTMLNEENGYLSLSESDASASHAKSRKGQGEHTRETSIMSISNFSMTTGSPGSLRLRPEHERHLGDMDQDMDSLNLEAPSHSGGSEDDGDW
ncbi:hypothetical protein V5O48_018622 [Marasmius crinis-equi]|uniref:Uncharacterized protein n=1 Tax=Marasmius crinis-equi TaxID=585013 RepID=A0ABR3EKR1_9AGAR